MAQLGLDLSAFDELLSKRLEELVAERHESWVRTQEERWVELTNTMESYRIKVDKLEESLRVSQPRDGQAEIENTVLQKDLDTDTAELPKAKTFPLQAKSRSYDVLSPNVVRSLAYSDPLETDMPKLQETKKKSEHRLRRLASLDGAGLTPATPAISGSPSSGSDPNEPILPSRQSSDDLSACWDQMETNQAGLGFWKSLSSIAVMIPRKALVSLAVALIVLLSAMVAGLYKFPCLVITSLCVIIVWLLYFCGEKAIIRMVISKAEIETRLNKSLLICLVTVLQAIHGFRSSRNGDQRFRSFLHFLCMSVILLNPDICLTATVRRMLSLQDTFRDAFIVLASMLVVVAIASYWLPRLGRGHKSSTKRLFKSLSELEQLDEVDLTSLLEALSTKDVQELFNIRGALHLLCILRVDDLSVYSKSKLLHALMSVRLESFNKAELAVENLLISTRGDDLSKLKSMQDGRGEIHSLRKLVFEDITDPEIRDRVLNHFVAEGMLQVAHRTLLASSHFRYVLKLGKRRKCVPEGLRDALGPLAEEQHGPGLASPHSGNHFRAWLKIIFDVDDTLMCSGGAPPAGIDERYAKHIVYPGVTTFLKELQGGGEWSQLVALSARPHVVSDVVEQQVFKRFRHLMKSHGLHAMPGLLPGDISSGFEFMRRGGDDQGAAALAQKKFENFKEYMRLYPEFKLIFIGDNGQGDYAVGHTMCCQFPDNVEQVWIHKVQPEKDTPLRKARRKELEEELTKAKENNDKKLEKEIVFELEKIAKEVEQYDPEMTGPIEFIEDYVMAAISAATRSPALINPEGLKNVITATADDFERIENWPSADHREIERQRLERSLARGCEVLRTFDIEIEEIRLTSNVIQADNAPARTDGEGATMGLLSWIRKDQGKNAPAVDIADKRDPELEPTHHQVEGEVTQEHQLQPVPEPMEESSLKDVVDQTQ